MCVCFVCIIFRTIKTTLQPLLPVHQYTRAVIVLVSLLTVDRPTDRSLVFLILENILNLKLNNVYIEVFESASANEKSLKIHANKFSFTLKTSTSLYRQEWVKNKFPFVFEILNTRYDSKID